MANSATAHPTASGDSHRAASGDIQCAWRSSNLDTPPFAFSSDTKIKVG